VRDEAAVQREGRPRCSMRRIAGIVMIGGAILYVINPSFMSALAAPLPTWLRWVGVGLAALSLPALVWVQVTLGKFWSRNLQLQQSHELITTGPYGLVRHPMYLVIFTSMLAIALISANWLVIVPALVAIGVIYSRIPQEERMMLEAFPNAYADYIASTGRLIPRVRARQVSANQEES
jgi:protein-S-isoprenylcysteine O-methyltransferase Ste14